MASANAAIECVESAASLETQLGDAGQGAKRAASTPRRVGRFPAHENNGIASKSAAMIRSATAVTNYNHFMCGALNLFLAMQTSQNSDAFGTQIEAFVLLAQAAVNHKRSKGTQSREEHETGPAKTPAHGIPRQQ